MSVRLPRLMDSRQLEKGRLHPLRLSLSLSLAPLSTAVLVLPEDDPSVSALDLVELYDERGSVGIFRVSAVSRESGYARTVRLEHGLCTLSDGLVTGLTLTGTLRQILTRLLACQPSPYWQLGEVEGGDVSVVFSCGYENLLTALTSVEHLLKPGLYWAFDQTTRPWTLHLRPLPEKVSCEGRLSRNLRSVRVTLDGSELCTRVYPFGAGQGTERVTIRGTGGQMYLDNAEAQAKWGVIIRTFTAKTVTDAATLKAVAERYLDRHSAPLITIRATAVDISEATGEALDAFRLGLLCRLALPEEGNVHQERVIGMDAPDLVAHPGLWELTLANRFSDTSDEIADMIREVTSGLLSGSKVTNVVHRNRAEGTYLSPIDHYFTVNKYPVIFSCVVELDPDSGVELRAVRVDKKEVPSSVYATRTFDALPYLAKDASGEIAVGRHVLEVAPDEGAVNTTVTLKVLES